MYEGIVNEVAPSGEWGWLGVFGNRYDDDFVSIGSVTPENAEGGWGPVFGVCLKNILALGTLQAMELVSL